MELEAIIRDLQDATSTGGLFKHIIEYEEHLKEFQRAKLYQFGRSPVKALVLTGVGDFTNREKAVFERAEKSINSISEKETQKKRKEKIESALNLLLGFYKTNKEKLKPETFILIAFAYLMRSLIIRPKGFTVPEKKKEALRKGDSFINKALDKLSRIDASNPSNKELLERAWRVKGQLCLELNHIGEKEYSADSNLSSTLKKALDNGCTKFHVWKADTKIAIRYSEIVRGDKQYLQGIINPTAKGSDLEKAKAYYMLDDKPCNNFKKHIRNTIQYLRTRPFSNPLWEETVCFIRKLREDKNEFWKKFALDTYEACLSQERKTSAIRLRWHWSRQRDLYDLAFLAVLDAADKTDDEKYKKMAEICDSHKSRSSLRWASLEAMAKSSEALKKMLEAYESALVEEYIKDYEAIQELTDKHEATPPDSQEITEAPPRYVVVHFYLNLLEGEGKGYALIYNVDGKTQKWEMRDFPYQKLFQSFLTWQTNYIHSKEKAADRLVQLCREIGNAMHFLFDKDIIPEDKDVLFIPHDFLHRLPLHAAIGKDAESGKEIVFLEKHPCCYLPAWSFAAKKSNTDVQGRVLLKNFPENPYTELVSGKITWADVKDAASPDDLKNVSIKNNNKPPEYLAILCHGKADTVNPFNSRLALAGNGISHLEILQTNKINIKGSKMILGACEADLVPPLSDILDEHLSITTAFFTNGATEILGTMWIAQDVHISEIIIKILGHKKASNMINELWEWQKTGVENYTENNDIPSFYKTVVFRVIGLCI